MLKFKVCINRVGRGLVSGGASKFLAALGVSRLLEGTRGTEGKTGEMVVARARGEANKQIDIADPEDR